MSVSFNELCDAWYEGLPNDLSTQAFRGFLATTALRLFTSKGSLTQALFVGAVAATATAIEAATRPIIRSMINHYFIETKYNDKIEKVIQVSLPKIIAVSLAAPIMSWTGLTSTIIISSIGTLFATWIFFNEDFYNRNTATIEVFI